jgi:hypothetical protein
MWTIDWSQVADAGVNLLEAVVNVVDSNYADVPGNFSDFFDNLDSVVDTHIMNGDYNSFNVRPFSGWDTLKANIPQYFVGAHAYSGVVETSGRKENNAQIEYRSAFYWTFKVANTNQGYNIDGIPQGSFSQCCNEDLAIWDFHNAVQSTALNGGIEDMANNMEESLNFTLLGGKYFNFQNTSHGPSLLQDGFINIRDNESLYASSSSGRAYTLSQCGCESFLTQRETLGGELILDFLTPNLSLEPDRLCPGNTPQLRILNASALEISDTCDLEIKISHETQGLMRTFVANGSNISLNLNIPGVYTVSYVNSCTGCVVSSQIELKECIENEQLECIWNKFNIFPNPLSVNWENLTIKACLEDCLDDPSDTVALAQLHNQYFPVTFTIRNIQGNLTFGPQQNVLQSASLNNFNCYEEIIDLTDASLGNFPFPAGLYLVIIQFANGQSKTRMLRII